MKVVSIVGARPQFIKAAPVSRAIRNGHTEILVHTGQHYDDNMSAVFFDELGIPVPEYSLNVGSSSHAVQTGAILAAVEDVLVAEQPDWTLIYGDTNSTLAGALAAAKLNIPIAHVEAGLRSFNRAMPEEINRVLADHVSSLLFCPSPESVKNLAREGITEGVHLVGDVMADGLFYSLERANTCSDALDRLGLSEKKYLLATVHRAENTDNSERLKRILSAFEQIDEPLVFPVHPRTRKALAGLDTPGWRPPNIRMIEPLGYLDMVRLEQSARLILTDSGGIQKEAYWLGIPCITLRDETEWVETVEAGWNRIVGVDTDLIVENIRSFRPPHRRPVLYGDGATAPRLVALMEAWLQTAGGRANFAQNSN